MQAGTIVLARAARQREPPRPLSRPDFSVHDTLGAEELPASRPSNMERPGALPSLWRTQMAEWSVNVYELGFELEF